MKVELTNDQDEEAAFLEDETTKVEEMKDFNSWAKNKLNNH